MAAEKAMPEFVPPCWYQMRRSLIALPIMLVALIVGTSMRGSPLSRLSVDAPGVEAVQAPDRVEAYRLGAPPGEGAPIDPISPLDFPVAEGPIAVPPTLAKEISEALLRRDWRLGLIRTECGPPIYGVKLSFHRGAEETDVYLCFGCSELSVVRHGKALGVTRFPAEARKSLAATMKELFPGDALIHAIDE